MPEAEINKIEELSGECPRWAPRWLLKPWLIPLLSALAVFSLYQVTLSGGFLADDYWYLDQAQTITFTDHPLLALRKGNFYYFRPLPSLLWSVMYHLFSLHAFFYRATSLCLHLAVVVAFSFLAWRLVKDWWGAGLATLVFGLCPLHAEAVCWVSANADLLATFFLVISLERFLAWREGEGHAADKKGALFSSLFFGLLALLSKESAYIWPLLLLFTELLPGEQRSRRERMVAGGIALGLTAMIFFLKLLLGFLTLRPPTGATPLSMFAGNLGIALLRFLEPVAPTAVVNAQLLNLLYFLSLLAHFVTALIFVGIQGEPKARLFARFRLHPRFRVFLFGVFFLVVALIPPATTSRIGPHLEFSRTLYLPAVGFALALASLFSIHQEFVLGLKTSSPPGLLSRPFFSSRSFLWGVKVGRVILAFTLLLATEMGMVNLLPWISAGMASQHLERQFREGAKNMKPGESALVFGVPMTLQGVPFHSNSYTLSVAFSIARFPALFKKRGFQERDELPFYAVSAEVPKIEARMTPQKKLRELIQAPPSAFTYHLSWDSPWAVKKVSTPPEKKP